MCCDEGGTLAEWYEAFQKYVRGQAPYEVQGGVPLLTEGPLVGDDVTGSATRKIPIQCKVVSNYLVMKVSCLDNLDNVTLHEAPCIFLHLW